MSEVPPSEPGQLGPGAVVPQKIHPQSASLDFGQVAQDPRYNLSLSMAVQENDDEAKHRRWMEKIKFCVGISALTIVFFGCLLILVFGNQSADEKKIVGGVLISLVSAIFGYVVKK